MDKFWYYDIHILKKRYNEFWPSKQMSLSEQLNAITRFTIYATMLLTLYKNDPFIILIGLCIILFIGNVGKSKEFKNMSHNKTASHVNPEVNKMNTKECVQPTKHNPFGNVEFDDYTQNPERNAACPYDSVKDQIHDAFFESFPQDKFDLFNKKHSQRQFFSTANTQIPNDQTSYAQWLYGSNVDKCKERPKNCTGYDAFGS